MREVAGGEGQGVKEVEKVEANLLVGLGGRIGGRRVLVVGEQSTMAEVDGVLVSQGEEVKGKVAGELHGLKVKLAEGLGWLEKGRRRRSTSGRARRRCVGRRRCVTPVRGLVGAIYSPE